MHVLCCLVSIRLFSNRKRSFVCSFIIRVMNCCALFCLYSPVSSLLSLRLFENQALSVFVWSSVIDSNGSNTLLSSLLPLLIPFYFSFFLRSKKWTNRSIIIALTRTLVMCAKPWNSYLSLSLVSFSFDFFLVFPCLFLRSHFPLEFNIKWCGIFLASFKFVAFVLPFNSMHMHTTTTSPSC